MNNADALRDAEMWGLIQRAREALPGGGAIQTGGERLVSFRYRAEDTSQPCLTELSNQAYPVGVCHAKLERNS